MALIEYRLDGTVNKVENAIKRIQLANLSKEPCMDVIAGGRTARLFDTLWE